MVFNWDLKEHHKLCLDEGFTVRKHGNCDYVMTKDEDDNYCLFAVAVDVFDKYDGYRWTKIASSKNFNNFKRKVADVFMEDK